ncbi:uncharacterized protein [Palaemon carinicauda]|uniref:uncharacterized protein n=1 Tax=Palaemon carinicauda TaxID=392227 RepID=UPI0035B67312
MDKLVKEENLQGAFPYLDNISIAGHTQEQHDQKVQWFLEVINKRNITLNVTKTIKSVCTINILNYCVGDGVIKPDMERLRPLRELTTPNSQGFLKRVEWDASEVAVSAVLNQNGRPVAFMSRTLQGSEVHYQIVEKEAMAIVEAGLSPTTTHQEFPEGMGLHPEAEIRTEAASPPVRRSTRVTRAPKRYGWD